jgi:flagellar hook assembly protein FlgD
MITSVKGSSADLATYFNLSQNYPNPFNPSTKFEYTLNRRATVKVEVFNELGQLITTLVDGAMQAGSYQVTWNGKSSAGVGASSGTYFYRLSTDGAVRTKKMIMLK